MRPTSPMRLFSFAVSQLNALRLTRDDTSFVGKSLGSPAFCHQLEGSSKVPFVSVTVAAAQRTQAARRTARRLKSPHVRILLRDL
jgi:hypothetical protein